MICPCLAGQSLLSTILSLGQKVLGRSHPPCEMERCHLVIIIDGRALSLPQNAQDYILSVACNLAAAVEQLKCIKCLLCLNSRSTRLYKNISFAKESVIAQRDQCFVAFMYFPKIQITLSGLLPLLQRAGSWLHICPGYQS